MNSILFRADASPKIGAGHVARCLALANVLANLECECVFAIGPETLNTAPALQRAGYEMLIADGDEEDTARALAQRFRDRVDWVVIDHYGIDAAAEKHYRPLARRLMVIDDLADRPHDCDLLLDQGPGRIADDYAGLVPAGTQVLAGAVFALLDPAYGYHRDNQSPATSDKPSGIYVSFGATDPSKHTRRGLDALDASRVSAGINVVLGAAAPHREEIGERLEKMTTETKLHIDTSETIALLTNSFMALGAGGVSALERCCCGVPSLVAVTADNQRAAAEGLSKFGAAQLVDLTDPQSSATDIRAFIADIDRRKQMSRAAQRLCDGRGARRAAMILAPEKSTNGDPVYLRPATPADEALILEWQKFPGARRFARNPDVPDKATHAAWMQATLEDPEILLNVIECNGHAAGVLRLDRRPHRDELAAFEVSLLVAQDHYRTGIGKAALALARRLVPGAVLLADIHPENVASLALFQGAGYMPDSEGFACLPADTPRDRERAHEKIGA